MNVRGLYETMMTFLFPPHCPACGRYVTRRGAWCPSCLAGANAVRRLRMTTDERAVIAEAWALGVYDGGLRMLVRRLKYQKKMETRAYVATFLRAVERDFFQRCALFSGGMAAAGAAAKNDAPAAPLVAVPVPLFREKERQRGFNQTELLFQDWLAAHGIAMARLLVRTRATRPQYGLTKDERKANMKGAFAVPEERRRDVEGRDILLLDDIYTTGVTCAECARALKAAGARRVVVLALTSGQK